MLYSVEDKVVRATGGMIVPLVISQITRHRKMLVFILLITLPGCNKAAMDAFMGGVARSLAPEPAKYMLFGGPDNKTYLGCISCNEFSMESIFNADGMYGDRLYPFCIWNQDGLYGSEISRYSWRNPYADSPPVIVDQNGSFYGFFTISMNHPKRTRIKWIQNLLLQMRMTLLK